MVTILKTVDLTEDESIKEQRLKGYWPLDIKTSIWISIWASKRDRGATAEAKKARLLKGYCSLIIGATIFCNI